MPETFGKRGEMKFFAGFIMTMLLLIIFIMAIQSSVQHSVNPSVSDASSLFGIGTAWVMFFAIFIIVFLIRALALWYWKIDKIVRLLEKIEENTRTVASVVPGSMVSALPGQEHPKKKDGLWAALNRKIF
ncbi:MAG: hypothetical protein WCL23_02285 [Candidatus Moraniibacteriota bacterium]